MVCVYCTSLLDSICRTNCMYISIFHRLVRRGHKLLQLISTSASRNTQLSVGIHVYLFWRLITQTHSPYIYTVSWSGELIHVSNLKHISIQIIGSWSPSPLTTRRYQTTTTKHCGPSPSIYILPMPFLWRHNSNKPVWWVHDGRRPGKHGRRRLGGAAAATFTTAVSAAATPQIVEEAGCRRQPPPRHACARTFAGGARGRPPLLRAPVGPRREDAGAPRGRVAVHLLRHVVRGGLREGRRRRRQWLQRRAGDRRGGGAVVVCYGAHGDHDVLGGSRPASPSRGGSLLAIAARCLSMFCGSSELMLD